MSFRAIGLFFLLCVIALPVWAADVPVQILQKTGFGAYLADGEGRSLYIFMRDHDGQSFCYEQCLRKWPAFLGRKVAAGQGVKAADFGVIQRGNGTQVTYRGYPLYYYAEDKAAGDTQGHEIGGVWFLVDPTRFAGDGRAR